MAGNRNLNSAKTARKDEFYTQLTDIEKEMRYYRKHFKGKTVLCNCDDPFESNFFKYFVLNAISYEETFSLMKNNKMWIGASIHSGDRAFFVPDDYPLDAAGCGIDEETGRKYIRVKGVRWFTNLDIKQRHEEMILVRRYVPDEYPTYVNYNAIEVAKTSDIPCDYSGEMGVPITFMDKYNPDQFEIVGISRELVRTLSDDVRKNGAYPQIGRFYLDTGEAKYKKVYERLVIRNKHPEVPKEAQ